MSKTSTITIERLNQLLDYNPETGEFFWKARGVPKFDNRFAGKNAGTFNNVTGYMQITIDHVCLRAHRVGYALFYGNWPSDKIDHINGIRNDNRIINLRDANNTQNMANVSSYSTNTTGYKGVHARKKGKPFEAAITFRGQYYYLGTYDTAEEAHNAYCNAAKKYFGEFANFGNQTS